MPFAPVTKKTTGLVGLAVCRNPQYILCGLYDKILRAIQKMPENAAYRKYTAEIVSFRLSIVKKACKAEDIEEAIKCGQCEELIVQAENELHLARRMTKWKPWEKLVNKPHPHQWTWPPPK
ncbi:hypothetical protein GE061_006150 [Apolygus lucorum]|uniref:NADH dehydrogenase [ubiquinone] 1 alpha subcomplex subunit 5 n=1 Tax=Apolygus lucorum TaxID=248454 RepID=A0A6A4IY78_APOLU|nr:hypothetical protein GE061_006150 [Apolygus lucorum]